VDEKTVASAKVPSGAKVVRLAVGRKVLWSQVQDLMRKIQATGARAVLLAGNRSHVKSFALEDEPGPGASDRAIGVVAYVDGKACVQPPGAIEAKCVQSGTKDYIERAYVRELVREQVMMFSIEQVEVELPATLPWADVVRTIDAARTCCKSQNVEVRVRLKAQAPASAE
jgi:hypothetical protein